MCGYAHALFQSVLGSCPPQNSDISNGALVQVAVPEAAMTHSMSSLTQRHYTLVCPA